MKEKKYNINTVLLIVVGILLIATIAVFIVILCTDYKFIIDWDWGSFAGGFVTLGGVWLTIKIGKDRDRKNKMPILKGRISYNLNENELSNEMIIAHRTLILGEANEFAKIIHTNSFDIDAISSFYKLEIKNEGFGKANEVKIKIKNPNSEEWFSLPDKYEIKTDESEWLYFKVIDLNNEYKVIVTLSDVDYKNSYKETGTIKKGRSATGIWEVPKIELSHPQKIKWLFKDKSKLE